MSRDSPNTIRSSITLISENTTKSGYLALVNRRHVPIKQSRSRQRKVSTTDRCHCYNVTGKFAQFAIRCSRLCEMLKRIIEHKQKEQFGTLVQRYIKFKTNIGAGLNTCAILWNKYPIRITFFPKFNLLRVVIRWSTSDTPLESLEKSKDDLRIFI